MGRKKWGKRRSFNLHISRKGRFLLFILTLIISLILIEAQISPILEDAAQLKAHSLAITSIEQAVLSTLKANPDYQNYQNLISMEKDAEGRVAVMIPNTMRLNALVADTILALDLALEDLQKQEIALPLGVLTGTKILAGFGPNLNLPFSGIASPNLAIKDQFEEAGINQTRHRIWLEIESQVLITAPFVEQEFSVATSLLLAESVIIGPIPDTYLNLGLNEILSANL